MSNFQSRRRVAMTLVIITLLALSAAPQASAQIRGRGKGAKGGAGNDAAAATPAAEETIAPNLMMSKTHALWSVIQALGLNQSDAALEALEQIVLGKTKFGAHNKQAAETALVALVARPSHDATPFLLKLFAEPDDKVRPGDTDYPASALRYDVVRVAGRVGSPELRTGLAKFYDQASPEIRSAMETAFSKPGPANFSAQVILLRSRALPDSAKANLRKLILEQNALALKQALKILDAPAKDAPATASGPQGVFAGFPGLGKAPGSVGAAPTTPSGNLPGQPRGGQAPSGSAATLALGAQNPAALALDVAEKMVNTMPLNTAIVAGELWQSDIVEALSAQLSSDKDKASTQQVLAGVASIPLKMSRERLRDYLQHKGPEELGQLERAAPATPAAGAGGAPGMAGAGGIGMGGRGAGGRGIAGGGAGGMGYGLGAARATAASHEPAYLVGADWLDPGSLVVLKTLTYKDRPKTRHRTPPPSGFGSGKRSPAAEKKAEELAGKQRQTEAQYEWRDTIERSVSHWDDRLSAVAEKREGEADEGADTKEKGDAKKDQAASKSKAGATKSGKETDAASAKTGKSAEPKSSDSKAKGAGPAPTPTVAVPFALRPGERITREFHVRWPDDLPSNLTSAVSEPLVVHYLQLEATDDLNRTATYYRSALAKATGTRPTSNIHDIDDGKWVDLLQRDPAGQRTRSLDILIKRQPADAEAKRPKVEDLTIQILMVEVESFEPEAKPADKKEQAKRDSP
jgi:hypothetical protein